MDDTPVMDNIGTEKNIFCLDISSKATIKTKFNLSVNDAKVDVMANCGLAFLNLRTYTDQANFDNTGYNLNIGTDRTGKESLGCVACKPGYKPDSAKTSSTDKLVRNCTIIPNCSTQN